MPVRNGSRFLSSALKSLLAQDFEDFQIIISDNCSEDSTEAICRAFAQTDSRIIYQRLNKPIEVLSNFALVLESSTSPLFMWAAHDDLWAPNWLSTLVPLLFEQGVTGAFGRLDQIDCDGNSIRDHKASRALLRVAESPRYGCRVLHFISAWEGSGKANLIYSVFRADALKITMDRIMLENIDFDCAILLRILACGSIQIEAETMFSKRLCLESDLSLYSQSLDQEKIKMIFAKGFKYIKEKRFTGVWPLVSQYRSESPTSIKYLVKGLLQFKRIQIAWYFFEGLPRSLRQIR